MVFVSGWPQIQLQGQTVTISQLLRQSRATVMVESAMVFEEWRVASDLPQGGWVEEE